VMARLTAALADAGPDATAPARPGESRATRAGLSVVPGEKKASPRRRWPRWTGPLAAAAAVVAALALALPQVLPRGGADDSASTAGGGRADSGGDSAPAPAIAPNPGQEQAADEARKSALADLPVRRLVASGTDYRTATFGNRTQSSPFGFLGGRDASTLAAADAPLALRRLTAPAALSACLAAVGREHSRPATAVDLVDLASFEGTPAVVIMFTDSAAEQWVVVSGPACGSGTAGADTRYRAKVG